jgi:hypothetical protein
MPKVSIQDKNLVVEIGYIFKGLDAESARSIARQLCLQTQVAEYVVEHLLNNYTEEGDWMGPEWHTKMRDKIGKKMFHQWPTDEAAKARREADAQKRLGTAWRDEAWRLARELEKVRRLEQSVNNIKPKSVGEIHAEAFGVGEAAREAGGGDDA